MEQIRIALEIMTNFSYTVSSFLTTLCLLLQFGFSRRPPEL